LTSVPFIAAPSGQILIDPYVWRRAEKNRTGDRFTFDVRHSVLADDLGYADVSFNGGKDIVTPHIDSIAKHGVRCSNGYVSAPMCAPSRCGLLTGRYQQRFGYEANNDEPGIGLPLTETTMAQRLQAAGYVTGAIGKWHLGSEAQFHPLSRGFDEFFGFLPGSTSYLPKPGGKSILLRNREPAPHTQYLTDQFGAEAVAFAKSHRAEPWFLYLAFNAPDTPLEAPPEYLARVAHIPEGPRRTYAAMVTALDDNVGRLLARLRETGQEERTLIVFLSDNGGQITIGARAGNNAPLSGEKGDVLEGGIRVPFALQWRGTLPAGQVFDAPVITLDLLPTFLAAAGVTPQPEWKLDGVNLLPLLTSQTQPAPRTLYWRLNRPVQNPPHRRAIRSGDWKLFHHPTRSAGGNFDNQHIDRLVNLDADIAERNDLSTTEAQRRAKMQSDWDQWNSELMEPFANQTAASSPTKSKAKATDRDSLFTGWDKNKDNQLEAVMHCLGRGE
jgi:arylsulfatase A-like enzyme